jgi:hypothetical protein
VTGFIGLFVIGRYWPSSSPGDAMRDPYQAKPEAFVDQLRICLFAAHEGADVGRARSTRRAGSVRERAIAASLAKSASSIDNSITPPLCRHL